MLLVVSSPAVCVQQSNRHDVCDDLIEQQYKAAGVLDCSNQVPSISVLSL
jgi:hypothetical protein